MSSKKEPTTTQRRRRLKASSGVTAEWTLGLIRESAAANGKNREHQRIKNPETAEQRQKRLAKREALTLRAFQIAYDNHHPRKQS